ncbi:MAG: hypothetical protein H0U00_12315 [Actinobacteria bacterium]|nr:hypothetical protein [Actinomycetota bacterium]
MSERNRRNVLVISSVERPVAVLRKALGDNVDELKVVVPAVKQSRLQWLTNADDDAREEAEGTAASIDDATSDDVEAEAGDSDPLQAAEDALAEFEADELVVVTRPDEEATWLEEGRAADIEQRFPGLVVTRVVVSESD